MAEVLYPLIKIESTIMDEVLYPLIKIESTLMAEVLYPLIKIKSNQLSWLRWIFTLACQTSLMHPCQARAPTRLRLYQKICPGPDPATGGIDHHQSYFYPHYTIAFNLQGVQKSRLT